MSKTQSLSQNFSRLANFLKFSPKENSILVGENQPYGSPTIKQSQLGVTYPNVQAAIDDMVALYTHPINTIIINTDGVSPAGVSQVDNYTFSGTVSFENLPAGTPVKFNCFGFYTDVLVGDTGDEVASKVKINLEIAQSQGLVFNSVTTGASLNILEIKYNDTQEHFLKEFTNVGITLTPTTVSPAKAGYGVWTRIGTETKTLDGSTEAITLYYFRRDN